MNSHKHLIYQNESNLSQKYTSEETEFNGDIVETYEEKIYREISLLNGRINRMDLNQLKMACKDAKVDCHGRKNYFFICYIT